MNSNPDSLISVNEVYEAFMRSTENHRPSFYFGEHLVERAERIAKKNATTVALPILLRSIIQTADEDGYRLGFLGTDGNEYGIGVNATDLYLTR